jgi:hypothetical protein
MLTSILRHRGIPTRGRRGFAPYIGKMFGKDLHVGHTICEVWNERNSRLMMVDPDRQMLDFPKDKFRVAPDPWR